MDKTNSLTIPIIETKKLSKKFGDFVANEDINIKIFKGKIHAIVGENGAGKSTLMKMLYGVHEPTSGDIIIDGKVKEVNPPVKAMAEGIGMVFQDFRLISAFTVLENILLAIGNHKKTKSRGQLKDEIIAISEKYNIPIDPNLYVWELDLGQRQRVEIIKVLMMNNTRILIFDEPTSVLTYHESQAFIEMLCKLREDGYGILLITHKLHEVISCADTITVLRQGKITAQTNKEDGFDKDILIKKMMGEDTNRATIDYTTIKNSDLDSKDFQINLKCENLTILDHHNREIIKNIDLEVRKGEILGIAGISGRGQKELVETIFGLKNPAEGKVFMNGIEITDFGIHSRIEMGIALISEDPIRDNVVPNMKIYEHMVLAGVPMKTKNLRIDWSDIKDYLNKSKAIRELGVPEIHRRLDTLSGGNVQRAVLARAIIKSPKVLLASYPSRGLDIGTVEVVHETLIELKKKGSSVILISEDLGELLDLSDQIVVIGDNKIYGPYNPQKTNSLEIGQIMLGGKSDAKS